MLDFRAWVIAGVILLAAAGSYVIWINRPKVAQTGRSLSSAGQHGASSNKPKTISLHVDGCSDDFIVKPGELVEPKAVPGAPMDEFERLYGNPTKIEDGMAIWDSDPFRLSAFQNGQGVLVSLNQGHVLETLDGIEMGIDSFGTIFSKMARDRKVQVNERIESAGGNWTLILSFYSSCGKRYRSEYSRTIPGSPEIDKLIAPHVTAPGGSSSQTPSQGVWRSDVFMNKIVSEYALVPSNGSDVSPAGSLSEHD